MRKGRHRRHQQARELKHQTARPLAGEATDDDTALYDNETDECVECLRWPHAEWCRADEDDDTDDGVEDPTDTDE
jgi:hypothetical protein